MTDKILVDSKFDYRIFNTDGYEYKFQMLAAKKSYNYAVAFSIFALALTLGLGYSTYYCFTTSHPVLGILSIIGCLLSTVITLHMPEGIDKEYSSLEYATARYNKSLLDNQDAISDAIYNAKEKQARHEATMKAIKMEKSLSFVREVEVER